MAKGDRIGNRKTREQRRTIKVPELGYYLIVTDTEGTERCFFTGLHQSLPEEVKNKLVIKVVETKTRMLIVNGFCDMPLNERLEDVFPQQMLKYCVSRGHVLLTSTQLLCLYIEVCKNPICKEERITELLSCVGKYERYREIKDYLK